MGQIRIAVSNNLKYLKQQLDLLPQDTIINNSEVKAGALILTIESSMFPETQGYLPVENIYKEENGKLKLILTHKDWNMEISENETH